MRRCEGERTVGGQHEEAAMDCNEIPRFLRFPLLFSGATIQGTPLSLTMLILASII